MADAYPIMLESAVNHLIKLSSVKILATCQTERDLRNLLGKTTPDILILDTELCQKDSLTFCTRLLKQNPKLKILLFATFTDVKLLRKYFQLGVYGYLPRKSRAAQLIKAVETIAEGQIFIPDFFRNRLAEISLGICSKSDDQLTSRERQVLKLIIEEHTTKEIAKKLYISSSTAETHRLNLIHKMGVRNTAGLVREGMLKGLYV